MSRSRSALAASLSAALVARYLESVAADPAVPPLVAAVRRGDRRWPFLVAGWCRGEFRRWPESEVLAVAPGFVAVRRLVASLETLALAGRGALPAWRGALVAARRVLAASRA